MDGKVLVVVGGVKWGTMRLLDHWRPALKSDVDTPEWCANWLFYVFSKFGVICLAAQNPGQLEVRRRF